MFTLGPLKGNVLLLESADLIDYFEGKVQRTMSPADRMEFVEQLFILLRHHRPGDLTNRRVLVYGSLPSLFDDKFQPDDNDEDTMLASVYDIWAFEVLEELYRRVIQHYLYDRNHRPLFVLRGMVGKNILLEFIPAGATPHGFQS